MNELRCKMYDTPLCYSANSQFDPQVVTDIAKNILSFLKTNATKEGHTYWLYKGKMNELRCKMYDTPLCYSANSQFDPQVVTDIAKNILSFLKTNATKEGHTYWLYKGKMNELRCKMYDTPLCYSAIWRQCSR